MMIAHKVFTKKTCDDTFAWAREQLPITQEGTLFYAEELTSARGRQDRSWKWYEGQLALTIVFKPPQALKQHLHTLNMAFALGILDPLKEHGVALKWPNDFIYHGKKIGGMIIEGSWSEGNLEGIILGFAINVNNIFIEGDSLKQRATSLREITGNTFDLETLRHELCASLENWYQRFKLKQFDVIFKYWKQAQYYLNRTLTVHMSSGALVSGKVIDILRNGDVVLQMDMGQLAIPFYKVIETTGSAKAGEKQLRSSV